MENKKYLTEENYEQGKKKLKSISLIILIIGILVGGSLILTGIIKTNNVKKQNDIVEKQVEENSETRTENDIQAEIDSLNSELVSLKAKQNEEFRANGFSEEYYRLDNEINTKENKIDDLEWEIWEANSGYNDTKKMIEKSKDTISTSKYIPLYIFGAFIIIASCMIAGFIYLFSKRREITAFTTQQIMPVAKEGIDEMAPTVGNAVGEIAKGIKNGLKDDEKK